MSAARDAGDSTPGSDVTRLFPKCRPRMHRHDRLNSGLEGREHSINNVSSDEERESQLVILNSKGSAYKLRDSRIIEIAGGRELYSQSRTKAVRKLRHSNTHKHNLRNKVRSLAKDTLDYSDNLSNEISLQRLNNEPKKMISRHTSPTYTNGDREPIIEETMGIPKNSSPILDPHKTNDVSTKSSPIAVVADGEVVVFDDNEDWKVILNSVSLGLRMDPDASDHEIDLSVKRTLDNMKNGDSDVMNNKSELSESESSPGEERSDASPSGVWMSEDEDKGRVTRVIGELPIAEYEGSPRRYGIGSQKQTVRSPRPGFPQRIVTESRDVTPPSGSAAFDYLYEFSETRKVLEEFFRCPAVAGHTQLNTNDEIVNFQELDYELRRQTQDCPSENGVEGSDAEWPHTDTLDSPHTAHNHTNFLGLQQQRECYGEPNVAALRVGSAWSGSASPAAPPPRTRAPLALSPETSDEGSDLSLIIMENELSEMKVQMDASRVVVTHLPIVEDGLSSGHASDNDNNNQLPTLQQAHSSVIIEEIVENGTSAEAHVLSDADLHSLDPLACSEVSPPPPAPAPHRPAAADEPERAPHPPHAPHAAHAPHAPHVAHDDYPNRFRSRKRPSSAQSTDSVEIKPASGDEDEADTDLETDRLLGQQRTDDQGFFDDKFLILTMIDDEKEPCLESGQCASDRKEVYSDNETNNNVVKSVAEKEPCLVSKDMDQCETECKENCEVVYRESEINNTNNNELAKDTSELLENKQSNGQLENIECCDKDLEEKCNVNGEISDSNSDEIIVSKNDTESNEEIIQDTTNCRTKKGWRKPKSRTVMPAGSVSGGARSPPHDDQDETHHNGKDKDGKKKSKNKEDMRSVLIEGVLFRARYLGSTQLACEGQPTKATRMLQAEEAVSRIKWGCEGPYSGVYAAPAAVFRLTFLGSVEVEEDKRRRKRLKKNMVEEAVNKIKVRAPEGENQPSTEVDLFISTEKIMVLNTELKEIMMDHALRTISYIADIGDLVVLMARRRFVPHETDSDQPKLNRTPKMICHVFESEEAQFIAQSIGQAFQVAYMEFLKANGIEDHSFVKEMDYQEVLNSQEIFGDELQMFAKKELQKEVVVPKTKGEILGVVVVESGWGSMLPTVVIANLAPAGAAARCGQLNIGDQIIAINGVSLVGLPLSTCQTYIKNSKNQTVVKLTVVPCAPVVEVKIKRPDTKYQLGFSVQNGVICSLLRGGIAERGGVRVGHRIIEINSQSVVAVPHERIVNLLATSVGEILMKTMPTSMFRLLTGQENPVFI
ncbi:uncharacterized protein LOC134680427 [Cydia fagiglandana]|uniref:uncharacterized protein LOC134680427 n=1 Tax=Cydia fagiglandana TaxID=1458189 RepID=UPI002FEE5869